MPKSQLLYHQIWAIILFPRHLFREFKWGYQRATRGFSDKDWWSFDSHIAEILSKALPLYVSQGIGTNSTFFEGDDIDNEESWKQAREKQDREYLKYADIFNRYANGGVCLDDVDAKESNGVTQEEYDEAMQWLAKNFGTLWD